MAIFGPQLAEAGRVHVGVPGPAGFGRQPGEGLTLDRARTDPELGRDLGDW